MAMRKHEWPYYRIWCCGRWCNPKFHVCKPVKTLGIVGPGTYGLVFTEQQYAELERQRELVKQRCY